MTTSAISHKFQTGERLELIVVAPDNYHSFAWMPVVVEEFGTKEVLGRVYPYYVVNWGNDTIEKLTVEEWQLRRPVKRVLCTTLVSEWDFCFLHFICYAAKLLNHQIVYSTKLPKGAFLEVRSEMEGQYYWFCAKVLLPSPAKNPKVNVCYRNPKWQKLYDDNKEVYKDFIYIKKDGACLAPDNDVTNMIWQTNGNELPARLISDEQHKIPEMCTIDFLVLHFNLVKQK